MLEREKKVNIIETNLKISIWNKINTNTKHTIKRIYNNKVRKLNKTQKKKLSYSKYVTYVKQNIYNHVKNNILLKPCSYQFAKKELYMIDIDKDTFSEQNIAKIMKKKEQDDKIKFFCNDFFTTKNA